MKRILLFLFFFGVFIQRCEAGGIKMATTTSVENSGLLDILLSRFEEQSGIKVHAISVGTGKALKFAKNGDVDLVLVHSPRLEIKFVKDGFGLDRKTVFFNDFVIVGPKQDPAQIKDFKKSSDVFRVIAQKRSVFISRGDDSGTNNKELEIWGQADVSPDGPWYIETGQGMGPTLIIADEKRGYCLVDRATFISYSDKVDLVILHEGDPLLKNFYSLIAVNPAGRPYIKYKDTKSFIDWVSSEEGKALINGFKKKGIVLFHTFDGRQK